MFTQEVIVSNNDVDTRFTLKVSALFRYFQDIALLATEEKGVDSISLSKRNIDWVITRMDVEIKRLPKCDEKIIVHTYPGKDLAMLYPRYFFITDEKGEIIVRCSSLWALINSVTRKVIVDRDVINKLPGETYNNELPLPSKIAIPDNKEFVEKRTIHYSDLDFNNHMNNVRYVELLSDVHDAAFYKNNRPSFISLNYTREIREKEMVSVFSDHLNPETIIAEANDELSFIGKITFVPR